MSAYFAGRVKTKKGWQETFAGDLEMHCKKCGIRYWHPLSCLTGTCTVCLPPEMEVPKEAITTAMREGAFSYKALDGTSLGKVLAGLRTALLEAKLLPDLLE